MEDSLWILVVAAVAALVESVTVGKRCATTIGCTCQQTVIWLIVQLALA